MKRVGLFVISLLLGRPAFAVYFETNFYYMSDNFVAASTTANGRTFLEATLGFSSDRKGRFILGWDYLSLSATDTDAAAATATLTATAMGPKLLIFFDRNRMWSLGLGYLLSATGSYSASAGATAETWTGTLMKGDLGFNYWTSSETWMIGVRLNYAAATFNRQLVSGSYTELSYTRAFIYPTINFAVDF